MSLKYIQEYYKVPAEYGREINFENKRKGVIVGARGQYIEVLFHDCKPGNLASLHPTWEVEYLGIKRVHKMTAGQKRYQEYLDSDGVYDSFAHFLGIKKK